MNGRSKRQAVAAVKICFDAIGPNAFGRIEMNAHEDGVGIRVGNCNARLQGDKDIAVSGHNDVIPAGGEKGF